MTISIIFIITIIVLSALAICIHYKTELRNYKTRISFKESLDLAELPIVTFYYNRHKLNFLLDTGSNDSHIASQYISILEGVNMEELSLDLTGVGLSSNVNSRVCNIDLYYRDNTFNTDVLVSEHLNEAFSVVKAEYGITIHGILGTKFLEKYKYVLDFDKLTAYQK